jgi:ubiquinone/menaquinone biosynthesis C-methylase UbiE
MNETDARLLLEKTKRDYDLIADGFSATRARPLEQFGFLFDRYLSKGDKILDLGCGNGRYVLGFREKSVNYVGQDFSKDLIGIAKKKFPEEQFIIGEAADLPYPSEYFDKIFCLAVLHHIPSRQFRKKVFCEAARALKEEGVFVATVWDLRPSKILLSRNWKRMSGFLKSQALTAFGRSNLDFGDFFIPWRGSLQRYVHSFSLNELKGLAAAAGLKVLEAGMTGSGSREGNLYIVAKKTQN